MAKLPADTHTDKDVSPFMKAMLILLAIFFSRAATVRAQQAADPAPAAAAEMVAEVRVVGNKSIPLEKITPYIRTRVGRPFDKDMVNEDVRRLDSSKMFINVKTFFQKTEGGRIIIYEVLERPILLDVKFIGNSKVSRKKLQKEAGLKAGDPLDTFAVEEARRKLEEYYRTNGYDKARVTMLEGEKPQDRRAIFLINEGVKQKVQKVAFIGNSIASDDRLQTQIKTGAPYIYLFKGELDRKELDEDVDRLTAYYRGLGFFRARIGREVREFDISEHTDPRLLASRAFREINQFEKVQWMVVTFIIDEGPRYKIGNVSVNGNTKFTGDELMSELKLKNGAYFNQMQMTADVMSIQDKYGGVGYAFADVKADPRFLEEPGTLDLVYNIKEGDRYRVGKIDVQIKGEYPHTKITTVLNRLSVKPGDIVDIREVRASERRLRYSQLFMNNPATGEVPKIVYSPPDKEMGEEDKQEQIARRPKTPSKVRGQSPEPNEGTWNAPGRNQQSPQRDREMTLTLHGTAVNPERWQNESDNPQPRQPEGEQQNQMIVRGQYTTNTGRSTPAVFQRPLWGGTRPSAATANTVPVSNTSPTYTQPAYSQTQPANSQFQPQWQPANTQTQPVYTQSQPAYTQTQPVYTQQQTNGTGNQSYAAQPYAGQQQYAGQQPVQQPVQQYADQNYPNQNYTAQPAGTQPAMLQPGQAYGNQQPVQQPNSYQYNAAGAMPPPDRPIEGVFTPDSPFSAVPPETGDPTRPLPFNIQTDEAMTGRFMFGVGVNSDAGLFGSIVIDEQNFDLFKFPRGWEDIKNFTAWRGAGQRLRIEAVPGTQVQRYMINFQEPYLFDSKLSLGTSGFYYSRAFTEWFEERIGGRVAFGRQFTPDLSGTIAYRGARVNISSVIDDSIPALAEVQGNNALHGFSISLAHDTRDNPFLATEGHLIEGSIEEVIGSFQYPRAELDMRRHITLFERPDGSGRHVLSLSGRVGYTGPNTPIYENYFAGGFSTIRGFDFRGASPRAFGSNINDFVFVGGEFMMLASAEYMFPITADDMLRGVVFCDTGTVEPTIGDWSNKYRVAPGFGLRVSVPAMGPAPIAFDFAFPVSWQPGDRFEMFSFFVGFGR
jgi:outer membrane protein insertion porin family